MDIDSRITNEIYEADEKYGDFNSTHEVYGVLMEEVEEFWDVVKDNKDYSEGFLKESLISELIQISAIAKRAAIQLQNNKIKHV